MPGSRNLNIIALSSLLVLAGTARADTLPQPLQQTAPALAPVGSGVLRWWGLAVYDARLYADRAHYNSDGALALAITYRRAIGRDQLLATTRDELERLYRVPAARLDAWLARLKQLWPNVRPGDTLTAHTEAGGATRFYLDDRELGSVADPDFGPAFLGIWLDARSRNPALRTALLGGAT